MIIWGALGVVALVVIGLLYALMSSDMPSSLLQYGARDRSALQTTISADGQMVAAIQERVPEQMLLICHLTNDQQAQGQALQASINEEKVLTTTSSQRLIGI